MTRSALALVVVLWSSAHGASAQIRPLTADALVEATVEDARLPLNGLLVGHDPDGPFARFQVSERMLAESPFTILIETPFFRAYYLASEARRRFQPLPPISIDELNAQGVIVRVMPGRNFFAADAIESVVLKRGDQIIRPINQQITQREVSNSAGAKRFLSEGVFQFPLETMTEQAGPYVLVCIGKLGNAYYPAMSDAILSMK